MATHIVRGSASGQYSCSCGSTWDQDEGDQCPRQMPERFQHLYSGVVYYVAAELDGVCELASIGRGVRYVSRSALADAEIWRTMP